MTVSRVINRSGYSSQETQQRVETAIAELGYVPNTLARSLRLKQTKTLALVVTDITNPFFTTLARGVEDAASDQDFSVIFCNTDESESKQDKYLTMLVQKRVDGVLLVPARSCGAPARYLQEHGIPVVVLDRRVPDCQVDSVRCDSVQGAHELTRLLLDLGHERIAVLSGPSTVSTAIDRVVGCREAVAEAGLGKDAVQAYHDEYTQIGGYRMARQALAATPRPTAFFAANNFIAVGAHRALREAGLAVPDDVAMVSFDDLPSGLVTEGFFTVVAQPAYEMGQAATQLLLDRLSGTGTGECRETILPTKVIIGRSSGLPVESFFTEAVQNRPARWDAAATERRLNQSVGNKKDTYRDDSTV
jgi:LacI family transcriptional regulator, galactose operon repressor